VPGHRSGPPGLLGLKPQGLRAGSSRVGATFAAGGYPTTSRDDPVASADPDYAFCGGSSDRGGLARRPPRAMCRAFGRSDAMRPGRSTRAHRRHRCRHGGSDDRGPRHFHRLVRGRSDMAFFAHPTLAGAADSPPPMCRGTFGLRPRCESISHHGGRLRLFAAICRRRQATVLQTGMDDAPACRDGPAA